MDDCPVPEHRNDLSWLEGSILAAMRTWVLGCKRGISTEEPVRTIFANLRAPEATEHLDRFMQSLSRGCTRMIEVYCTCEPVLSADEVLLLDVFAMMQDERHDAATTLLHRLVAPGAAYEASGDALAVVQLLNNAGNVIPRGPAAERRHARSSDDPIPGVRLPMRLH